MRTAPKIAISLFVSIIIFSGLAVAAYAGLFNILETRFYQPTVIKSMETHLAAVSDAMDAWHGQNRDKFKAFVEADAVKRSLLPNQSAQDIFDRSNLAGSLLSEMPGLIGIRIIDAGDTTQNAADDTGKRRIHFSTFPYDILKKEDFQISYENYGKTEGEIPFSFIARTDRDAPLVITEASKDRFLYCFPFRDAYSTWRGTAVFYVSARSAAQNLVSKNLFLISDELVLLNSADFGVTGAVTGMPKAGQDILANAVLGRWTRKDFTTDKIVSTDKTGWVLLSHKTGNYGYTGELVQESVFAFPQTVRIFFLTLSFLTVFLVVFLLLNLKQDDMIVIRNRVRRFQVQLLGELMEKTDDARWEEIRKNLAYRKHDITAELKKGLGRRFNKKHGAEIDSLLNKSWEEILTAIGHQETKQASITNAEEIKQMLEQVLQNNAINLNLTGVPAKKIADTTGTADEVEELGELEEPEELAEAEAAGDVEELGELEEPEELAEEEAGDVEELGELEEPEELAEEEAGDVEELGELEEPEELAEAKTAGDVEELGELEEPEELAEEEAAGDVEELGELEEPEELAEEEAGDVEELGELEEPEAVEETNAVEKAEAPEAVTENRAASVESEILFEDYPEINVYSFDELKELDDYIEVEAPDFFDESPVMPAEADEVEYLDGEWEPELLEVATEEELNQFIEENIPDEVLVYNFEETPQLDGGWRMDGGETDVPDTNVDAAKPDFSSLDDQNIEDATEVDYIDSFLLNHEARLHADIRDGPVTDFLEIIGDSEPEELTDLDAYETETGDDAVVNRDGIYIVATKKESSDADSVDPEFQKLVDSVLL